MSVCVIEGCSKPVQLKKLGYCSTHSTRWYRHGDPLKVTRRPSSRVSAAERKEYVRKYKLEHGCADCGYKGHHAALDFDHRLGTEKVRDIKSGQQLGWGALLEEIAKCDVVCANCHRIRTYLRRQDSGDIDDGEEVIL